MTDVSVASMIKPLKKSKVFFIFYSLFYSYFAWSDTFQLNFVRPEKNVLELQWDSTSKTQHPKIQIKIKDRTKSYYVTLKGKYSKNNSDILYNNQKTELNPDGEFTITVDIHSAHETFNLIFISDTGEVQKENYFLEFEDWPKFLAEQAQKPGRNLTVSSSAGFTLISYNQSGISTISEIAFTPKISALYTLSSAWEVGANAFYNAFLLTNSPSDQSIKMLGFNIKSGYKIQKLTNKNWSLKVSGGYYYTTAFSSSDSFGYNNINGIELFPVLTHFLPKNRSMWVYFKYSPIVNGLSLLSLNNTEIGVGAGFAFTPLSGKHTISTTLDMVSLKLQLSEVEAQANSYTLGASYQF